MQLPEVDRDYLVRFLTGLLNTPSPTGFTDEAIAYTESALQPIRELEISHTPKGALLVRWQGKQHSSPRAVTAHVDTLGAMVKEIKPNGRLKLSQIGGYNWNTIEGEGCTVFTSKGKRIRGSILLEQASSHIFGRKTAEIQRSEENMEVRLDERTNTAEETRAIGIEVGDFIAFDPRVEVTNGFIRSRHLDDKACVACIVAAAKALSDAGIIPQQTSYLFISNYEEVGIGAASDIPDEVVELLAADMAAVGNGQTSDEFHASICVKDSGGPYHYQMTRRLKALAEQYQIPYKTDIYVHYGSDAESYWRAGGKGVIALIGPGVDASHNYERTHLDALLATTRWLMAYLLSETF